MFVSVKERARQIASGQFAAPPSSAPVASLIDLAPEPKPTTTVTPKKAGAKETAAKASSSKTKVSKTAPPKDTPKAAPTPAPTPAAPPKVAPPKATPIGAFPQTAPTNPAPPPEPSTPKKSSSKSRLTKEPSSKAQSPKIGSSKSTSSSKPASEPKATSQPKVPSSSKPATPTKSLFSKASSTPSKPPSTPTTPSRPKRAKSPPKRVDSPISDTSSSDPLSELKAACLKQVSGITGLGGRRLAIALKQRSSGEYYVALKDVGGDKYLKMWMNRDKTYATKEEALEKYLVWVSKMRNEVRWFSVGGRAGSPPAKAKK